MPGVVPRRALHLSLGVLVLLVCTSVGCARVRFRVAMSRVHGKYIELFDRVEAGLAEESRASARAVRLALDDDAITGSAWFRESEEFRELHGQALEALDDFQGSSQTPGREELILLRYAVSGRCQSCHDGFRAP